MYLVCPLSHPQFGTSACHIIHHTKHTCPQRQRQQLGSLMMFHGWCILKQLPLFRENHTFLMTFHMKRSNPSSSRLFDDVSCEKEQPAGFHYFSFSHIITETVNPTTHSTKQTMLNLTIFDWDDTLLCSSVLVQARSRKSSISKRCVELLEQKVYSCLVQALKHGPVAIITNSEPGWVQQSCNALLPRVLPLLQLVTIIYAKHIFGTASPQISSWKVWAFKAYVSKVCESHSSGCMPMRIISIGDADYERDALFSMKTPLYPNTVFVSFKMKEAPSLELLTEELEYLGSILAPWLLRSPCDLNLAYSHTSTI
jgi:hypothetical protein